jgi:hypothetical protein
MPTHRRVEVLSGRYRSARLQIFEGIGGLLQALGVPERAQIDSASAFVNCILGLAGQYAPCSPGRGAGLRKGSGSDACCGSADHVDHPVGLGQHRDGPVPVMVQSTVVSRCGACPGRGSLPAAPPTCAPVVAAHHSPW